MSKRKTYGLEWLYLSMASFNGSGYADKSTPETYVASYKAFKTLKKDKYAHQMLELYPDEAYDFACELVFANDPGHTPSEKNLAKFREYYNPEQAGLL
jgi:hypothetical protein